MRALTTIPSGPGAAPRAPGPAVLFARGAAAVVTALVAAGVVALLVAEYALLWAVLVAPWVERLPAHWPCWAVCA